MRLKAVSVLRAALEDEKTADKVLNASEPEQSGSMDLVEDEKGCGLVIMASGLGRRFGGNKLMAELGGKPMIKWILDATEGLFEHRVVVTRSLEVKTLCESQGIDVILHELPGRNDTVRLGLTSLKEKVSGCMFCPGDQPLLKRETIEKMIEEIEADKISIWRLAYEDTIGTPTYFPRWAFPELLNLPEGKGGNVVVKMHPHKVKQVQASNELELRDVDTVEELEEMRKMGVGASFYSKMRQ